MLGLISLIYPFNGSILELRGLYVAALLLLLPC